jgi:hypothetical protein
LVLFEGSVDAAGEVSFGCSDGFVSGFALGLAAGDVVVGFSFSGELGDDCCVGDPVEGAVAPAVEAVALLAA